MSQPAQRRHRCAKAPLFAAHTTPNPQLPPPPAHLPPPFLPTAKQRQEATLARAEAELERMERRKKELERQLGLGLPGRGGLPRD